MRCPSCFDDKGQARTCPSCQYDERPDRPPSFLPYRHLLRGGRYVIGQQLGKAGGFGVAYKALDTQQQALVVIKECLLTESGHVSRDAGNVRVAVNPVFEAEYRRWQDRFRKEAALIARFESPYIVRVTEVFDENNTAYYVMPYVEGEDLRHHCAERGGRLPPDEVAQLAQKLLTALVEIHRSGYLHRDIKPSNIIITRNRRKPVLIDFGAARESFDLDRSGSHLAMFSPQYAPYEQVSVRPDQGPWTDLYALSATLYHCLVGEPPPPSKLRHDARGQRPDPFMPVHQRLPGMDSGLAMVIDNGLALLPAQRVRDATTALRLLDESTRPAGASPPPGPVQDSPAVSEAVPGAPLPVVVGLLPAAAMLAYGLVAAPHFGRYIGDWPGLLVMANGVVWCLWLVRRRAAVTATMARSTTGLGPASVDPVPGGVSAVELRLSADGMEPLVHVVHPGDTVVVGRGSQADLVTPNALVSGRHLSITVHTSGEFVLEDLKSTNHTFMLERGRDGAPAAWKRIQSASGRKGRFMLGPNEGGGVLLEIRQTSVAP